MKLTLSTIVVGLTAAFASGEVLQQEATSTDVVEQQEHRMLPNYKFPKVPKYPTYTSNCYEVCYESAVFGGVGGKVGKGGKGGYYGGGFGGYGGFGGKGGKGGGYYGGGFGFADSGGCEIVCDEDDIYYSGSGGGVGGYDYGYDYGYGSSGYGYDAGYGYGRENCYEVCYDNTIIGYGGKGGKGGKGGYYGGYGGFGGKGGKGGKGGYYGGFSNYGCEIICDEVYHEPACGSSVYCKYNCCPHKPQPAPKCDSSAYCKYNCCPHVPVHFPKCDPSSWCNGSNCCYQPPQQLRCYEDCFFSGGGGFGGKGVKGGYYDGIGGYGGFGGKGGKGGKGGGYYGGFSQCTIFCEGDLGWNNMYWNYEDYAYGYGRDKNYWSNTGGYIGGGAEVFVSSGAGYYAEGYDTGYSATDHKYNPMPVYQPPKCDPSEWCYDYNCCKPQQNCYEICEWVSGGGGHYGGKGGKGGKGGYYGGFDGYYDNGFYSDDDNYRRELQFGRIVSNYGGKDLGGKGGKSGKGGKGGKGGGGSFGYEVFNTVCEPVYTTPMPYYR